MTEPIKARYRQLSNILDSVSFNRAHTLLIFLVALGAIFDAVEQYNAGYAAPALTKLWGITPSQVGLLTTFTFGGMALGSLIAGITGDKIGRKITYMYNLALYTFGALICAFAPNIEVLYFGRLVVGIGLGGELNTGLTIVSEFVSTKVRGSAVAVVNIAAGGLGIFLSAAISFLILGPLSPSLGGDTVAWRWLFGILVLPALLLWVYRLYIPESPRYLLSRGRVEELNTVLSLLEARTLRKARLGGIKQYFSHKGESELEEKVRLGEIFQGYLAKRTAGLWIISWMTFGAQVTITVLLPTVLVARGFNIVHSLFFTMIINVGGLIGAIFASFFAAKLPRRWVLSVGALVAVGVALLYAAVNTEGLIILVGALMQFMFILLNTTTWLYAPELYPTRIRAFGTGSSVVVSLIGASVMPYVAGRIFEAFQVPGLFGMVAVMYFVMAATVWIMNVETKDRSLEELSEI